MAADPRAAPTKVERALDRLGGAASWIWLVLVAVIVIGVLLRALFDVGRIDLEELQWHLYAVGFLVGIVGCVVHDRHVRVDVFRERMSPRQRDWVDLYGLLLFQLPFFALVAWCGIPLAIESFAAGERSGSAGGLPFRWILKSALPLAFTCLIVASLSRIRAVARRLFGTGVQGGSTPADEEGSA
jgi:TRAP-type mannitol/chloroaromatic compound transport system permease small subunit